jgi:intraflagellar transport protein 46
VKQVAGGEGAAKEVERCVRRSSAIMLDIMLDPIKSLTWLSRWITSISDLHRTKPPPSVNYRQPMPSLDRLLQVRHGPKERRAQPPQEWPAEFEARLAELPRSLPDGSGLELETYADLVCGLLDIPVYKSRLQSLHLVFSLYLAFSNSAHFARYSRERPATHSRGFLDPL